jgi:hypothetical protein
MATGRNNKLVGQTGEYLVAAELSRRGLIATTFTGNVPHYDIIASDERGRHVPVQVKTIRAGTWQFADVSQFCELSFEDHRQIIGKAKRCPVRRLICVFVKLGDGDSDRFFVIPWANVRDKVLRSHRKYLNRHDGVRPKKWSSTHVSISVGQISAFENRWDIIGKNLA